MKIFHREKKQNSKIENVNKVIVDKENISKVNVDKESISKESISKENINKKNINKKIMLFNEPYKTLRTNIQFYQANNQLKTLVITSSCPKEGKSTTVFNLANAFGESGKKVLIIDCDLRKPNLHKLYNVPNDKGITDLLATKINIKMVLNKSRFQGVDFITCGTIPPNPSELLNSKRMELYLKSFKKIYDYIIIDTPPICMVTDAQILAGKCDGTLLVIASGQIDKNKLLEAKNLLDKVGANIVGCTLNKVKASKDGYDHYYN